MPCRTTLSCSELTRVFAAGDAGRLAVPGFRHAQQQPPRAAAGHQGDQHLHRHDQCHGCRQVDGSAYRQPDSYSLRCLCGRA